jgi:hypothetical protein
VRIVKGLLKVRQPGTIPDLAEGPSGGFPNSPGPVGQSALELVARLGIGNQTQASAGGGALPLGAFARKPTQRLEPSAATTESDCRRKLSAHSHVLRRSNARLEIQVRSGSA